MNLKNIITISSVVALILSACDTTAPKQYPGIDLTAMDTNVSPKDDFYRYVNGKWIDSIQIPEDQTVWGGFNKLRKDTDADVLAILDHAISDPNFDPKSDQAKAIYIYQSIMDTINRDKHGYTPVQPYLDQIEAITSIDQVPSLLAQLSFKGLSGFYSFRIGPDAQNTNVNVAHITPGTLGMQREYYVNLEDPDNVEKLAAYQKHIERMFKLTGTSPDLAVQMADRVVALETQMAHPRLDKVARRNPHLNYNPMGYNQFKTLVPAIDWDQYFNLLQVKQFDTLIVSQPEYMKSINQLWSDKNIDDIKAYLRWSMIDASASILSTELENANWDFYSKTMRGAKQQRPYNERALSTINNNIGEALGKLYVSEKFPAQAKEKAKEMIEYVKKAYEIRINDLTWMSADTKTKAIEKLRGMTIKIGYPDQWKDYSKLQVKNPNDGATLFDNMIALKHWKTRENLNKLDQPVDKSEWFMPPQMVNAYYYPYYNEIVFPAAILQPPFYNYEADDAINFGGMGAVIGHEISHGFDDTGAKYDADGNMVNWWTDADKEQFEALGKKLAVQYSAIEVLPNVFINGDYTLGENIGDLGGVNAAFDAHQLWMADKGKPEPIDGFTAEQRFFMSWATVWRTKMREEALKQRIKGDTHSPGMYRGYVPLQNIDAFYKAFGITQGDQMFIPTSDRVTIW